MTYSEFLQRNLQITLDVKHREHLERHFLGAGHHYVRMLECAPDSPERLFHTTRFEAHFRQVLVSVFRHGDFKYATDPTQQGLDEQENWHPDHHSVDPELFFKFFTSDKAHAIAAAHPLDEHLSSFEAPKHADIALQNGQKIPRGKPGQA